MANQDAREPESHLSPREAAHLRVRDRKRTTRMVVDNAGLKRVLQAQRDRAAQERAQREDATTGADRSGRR
jgi:hypothetical protein